MAALYPDCLASGVAIAACADARRNIWAFLFLTVLPPLSLLRPPAARRLLRARQSRRRVLLAALLTQAIETEEAERRRASAAGGSADRDVAPDSERATAAARSRRPPAR